MDNVDPKQLREARNCFRALLEGNSKEHDFQNLFAQHPCVLIPSLPLRLDPKDIVPMGRPGRAEPDFIFYPHDAEAADFYGVIELKCPNHKIATITRSNTAILTRDAQSAVAQAQQYIKDVPGLIQKPLSSGHLFLGNERYLFVIMGLTTQENIFKVNQKTFLQSIQNQLQPFGNLHILPYDYLLSNFEKRIYRHLHILVPVTASFRPVRLRTQPRTNLSIDEVKTMLREKGFYESDWNRVGKGLKHQYEVIIRNRTKLVVDHATALIWQQSGSENWMRFSEAQNYVRQLNQDQFAGYSNWRLPTLEEAMSLMEPEEKSDDLLNIDPAFNEYLWWIWTADKDESSVAWGVNFENGNCNHPSVVDDAGYVRAVDHLSYLRLFGESE